MVRSLALACALLAAAAAAAVPAAAAQPPGDAAANLAGSGKLDAALALLDTWLADHPNDPRMFPMLLQVVTAAPQQPTVDAVVARYRNRLAGEQVAVLRAAPADLAELRGGVEQALQALELPGVGAAAERRAVLLLELGEVTLDTAPPGMAAVHAGLARSGEGLGEAGLEPSLRAAFEAADAPGAGAAVAGYGLVSLLAANGRADRTPAGYSTSQSAGYCCHYSHDSTYGGAAANRCGRNRHGDLRGGRCFAGRGNFDGGVAGHFPGGCPIRTYRATGHPGSRPVAGCLPGGIPPGRY